MKKALIASIVSFSLLGWAATSSFADTKYTFNCGNSFIKGSIQYSVIGQYNFYFKECSGAIIFDSSTGNIKSARLEIKIKSIHSNCRLCDKAVVSKKLLDANTYPFIIVESDNFGKDELGYWMRGVVHLHGISQNLKFPFTMSLDKDKDLILKGKWALKRKDFNVVWNKLLDHGGIVVGDYVVIDCKIKSKIK